MLEGLQHKSIAWEWRFIRPGKPNILEGDDPAHRGGGLRISLIGGKNYDQIDCK